MSVLRFLVDRRRSCAECSLNERQAAVLAEELESVRESCAVLAEGFQEQEQICNDLIAIVSRLSAERDQLIRELWLERRRNDELRVPERAESALPAGWDANPEC